MTPFIKPCPHCKAGKNDNNHNSKKQIKIGLHKPIEKIKGEKAGRFFVDIRCKECGYRIGPFFQKKNEKTDELKARVIEIWNHIEPRP